MLFLEDSYLKDFQTKLVSVTDNKIILEQTIFYAKSGGQPGDIGTLKINKETIEIIDTIKENNNIIHISNNKVIKTDNDSVYGKIDWDKRYKFMRMHSALHLICAVIPFGVTGGQIGYDKSRLDFDLKDQNIIKEEIEEKVNQLILENHTIDYKWITSEELDNEPELVRTMSVKPPRTSAKIRLVKIGNVDLQPCGGTHVKNTKEIGKVSIIKLENKGKKNRRINISLG